MHAHETYRTGLGMTYTIRKVARDHTWADVTVTDPGGLSWNKRQRLVHGEFPFAAQLMDTELVEVPATEISVAGEEVTAR